jgi:recombination protein RecA
LPPRLSELEKFRAGLVRRYGDRVAPPPEQRAEYEVLPSGSLTLDWALRRGGLLRGRLHELVGPPDSAKTTLVINGMARAQQRYPQLGIGYVDMEGTFDDDWAQANGLDLSKFDHLYADDSETAADQMRDFARSGLYSMAVLDSIGAMESRKALEKDAKDTLPGRNAQVVTRMCKQLGSLARQTKTTVILVNQLRANIGGMGGDISAGPKEMKHATTTRIAMGSGSQEPVKMQFEEGQPPEIVCLQFKARVTRMKAGAPGRIAEFWVNNRDTEEYGPAGINEIDEYISVGVRLGAIDRDGAGNYTLPGVPKAVKGRGAAVQLLRARPELCIAVRERIFRGATE